jgi:hypothetical protein
MRRVRGHDETPPLLRAQPILLHEPRDPLTARSLTAGLQLGVDSRAAIPLVTALEDLGDLSSKALVPRCVAAGSTRNPGVEA